MKKNVKKVQFLSLIIIMAFMLIPFTSNGQGSKANFAGTWAMNAEKSDQPGGQGGGMGRMGGGNFVAKQEANLLTVDRTRTGQDGQATTTTSKYTLDGKESVNTTGRGESKSVATWSADGKSLTIKTSQTFDMGGESRTMTTSEVWSLTNPTTLSVKTTRTGPNGDTTTNVVYDKK
jgi:hypothetical protein